MKAKINAILDASFPNEHARIFALRLLASSKRVRREWFEVGYRFPWQRAVASREEEA